MSKRYYNILIISTIYIMPIKLKFFKYEQIGYFFQNKKNNLFYKFIHNLFGTELKKAQFVTILYLLFQTYSRMGIPVDSFNFLQNLLYI